MPYNEIDNMKPLKNLTKLHTLNLSYYEEGRVGTPVINGVQALELSNYVLRIRAETTPVMQWAGARAIRKEIKENLFEEGIEIPLPRMVVYSKDEEGIRSRDH